MSRDYYEVLEIPRDATPDVIKKAYRKLARKYHPDVNKGDKKTESKFKEVQAAYDLLSDPEKRALFDRYGHAAFEGMAAAGPQPGGPGWSGHHAGPTAEGFDFNDLFRQGGGGGPGGGAGPDVGGGGAGMFEELLGRMRGGPGRSGAGARRAGPRPGQNLEAALNIPFMTAVCGGETEIRIEREGRAETRVVKIPPGIESGAKLRLRGQGEPGEKGAPDGDMTIKITIDPHPYFTRDGRNLTVEVPITIGEAVLGAKVDVPTLDGLKSLPVPAGSSTGLKLRLRGQGLPESGDKPKGDLFVVLKVVVPKNVDDESKALIRDFSERNPSRPRDGLW